MLRTRRVIFGGCIATALLVATAGPALAHECVNASKRNQAAGVQAVIDANTDEIVWVSAGLQSRIDRGLVDPDTGEGFRGLLGFDFDGDAVADLATYIVGPFGEIALQAQFNGAECHGIVNIETFFTSCMAP